MFEKFWANSPELMKKKESVEEFFIVLQCVKLKKKG